MRPSMRPVLTSKSRKGFTLLELVVAMAVFSILGSVLVSIFVAGVQYFSNEKSQLFNQFGITELSGALESDARKASSASTASGCLVFTISSGNTTYCLNTSTHKVTRNSSVIADQISTFNFTITLNKLSLVVTSTNDQRGVSNTINLTYYLREGNY